MNAPVFRVTISVPKSDYTLYHAYAHRFLMGDANTQKEYDALTPEQQERGRLVMESGLKLGVSLGNAIILTSVPCDVRVSFESYSDSYACAKHPCWNQAGLADQAGRERA